MHLGRRIVPAIALLEVLGGCTIGGMDILPARLTRPDEAARDVAAEEERQAAEHLMQAELEAAAQRNIARVLVMSGDSTRAYDVLGQVTASGSTETTGFAFAYRGIGTSQSRTVEYNAFDVLKIQAIRAFGDRVDALIGVVCQGLTCTGTAVHWK